MVLIFVYLSNNLIINMKRNTSKSDKASAKQGLPVKKVKTVKQAWMVENFAKSEENIFYFNYKSKPDQIIEKGGFCDSCYENISDYASVLPEEGEECPNCGENLCYHSNSAKEFFDTDQDDDSIAGFAYSIHNVKHQVDGINDTGTITIQGVINFDKKTVRKFEYDKKGNGVLSEEKPFSDFGIRRWMDMSEVKVRLDLFTQEWNIMWEISEILDNSLKEVY